MAATARCPCASRIRTVTAGDVIRWRRGGGRRPRTGRRAGSGSGLCRGAIRAPVRPPAPAHRPASASPLAVLERAELHVPGASRSTPRVVRGATGALTYVGSGHRHRVPALGRLAAAAALLVDPLRVVGLLDERTPPGGARAPPRASPLPTPAPASCRRARPQAPASVESAGGVRTTLTQRAAPPPPRGACPW